ncbi:hypothetical protein FOCC_FOCC006623 [Frankliniella occidentalis]|nr:hypothetical protein FOCC_FOCC006623 [Frankliniella occidentalis]
MMETPDVDGDGSPPCKAPRLEDARVQQLQRDVDAGRQVVKQLRGAVLQLRQVAEALDHDLDSAVAQLQQVEEALERGKRGEAAGDAPDFSAKQMELQRLCDAFRPMFVHFQLEKSLLSLPDLPLVQVLSHLSAKDLGAVGEASPRLAALIREHSSLWRRRKGAFYRFRQMGDLSRFLRLTPPFTRLTLRIVRSSSDIYDDICVKFPRILNDFGPRLERLEIAGLNRGLDLCFIFLRDVPSLQRLRLTFAGYYEPCTFMWPQDEVLSKLHTVELAFADDWEDFPAVAEDDEAEEDDDVIVNIEGGDIEHQDGNVQGVYGAQGHVDDGQGPVDEVQGQVDEVQGQADDVQGQAGGIQGQEDDFQGQVDDFQGQGHADDVQGEVGDPQGEVNDFQGGAVDDFGDQLMDDLQGQVDDIQAQVDNAQGQVGDVAAEEVHVVGEEDHLVGLEDHVVGEEDHLVDEENEFDDDDNDNEGPFDDHFDLDDVHWVEDEEQREPDSSLFVVLRSLLLSHEGTLHHLRLDSPQLLPLLDSFASGLQRLTLTFDGDRDVRGLQQMSRLKHLTVFLKNDYLDKVAALLKSCPSPLERLELRRCTDGAVRSLGAAGLTSLQHLVLSCHSGVGSLGVALAGLPNLRSLRLLGLHKPTVTLSPLSAAAIPKLAVIVFMDSTGCGSDSVSEYSGFRDCQDLVRRSPMPLHVVAVFREERDRHMMFFRHPAGELCPLCAEAEAASSFRVLKNRPFERIQVE